MTLEINPRLLSGVIQAGLAEDRCSAGFIVPKVTELNKRRITTSLVKNPATCDAQEARAELPVRTAPGDANARVCGNMPQHDLLPS